MKQKAINIVLTLIVILVTFFISPLILLHDGYNTLKLWVMLTGGALLLILLLTNIKKIKVDKKDVLLLIFLCFIFISTIFSSNIKVSIWGQRNRYEGMLMFFAYACIYFNAKKFYNYENKKEFFNFLFYTFMVIGLIGIMQKYVTKSTINLFGNVYNVKRWYPIFNKGVNGTFGNSNFFGSFITIVLPISTYIFIVKGSKKAFLLSQIMFFNLISCTARSAWVAFFIGVVFYLIFLIKQKNKTYLKRTLALLIVFIIIGTYLFGGFTLIKTKLSKLKQPETVQTDNTKKTKKTPTTEAQRKVDRIKKEISTASKTGDISKMGSGRISIWKMTIKLIMQKPIFGCGTDNLRDGLRENCTEDFANYFERTKTEIDKAHNEYLHIAATIGIPALIIYLSFLGIIVFPKMKVMFKDKIMFIFTVTIICYLTQAFFNISTIGVAPLFWMFLGLSDNKEFIDDINI